MLSLKSCTLGVGYVCNAAEEVCTSSIPPPPSKVFFGIFFAYVLTFKRKCLFCKRISTWIGWMTKNVPLLQTLAVWTFFKQLWQDDVYLPLSWFLLHKEKVLLIEIYFYSMEFPTFCSSMPSFSRKLSRQLLHVWYGDW